MTETESRPASTEEQETPKKAAPSVFAGFDYEANPLSMEAMLAAGVHFGHPTSRRNPKMRDFIYGARNKINIIDLAQTVPLMQEALNFLASVQNSGKKILFVATKKQAQQFVVDLSVETGHPYVIERWLGGTLTNFTNIRKRVKYMIELDGQLEKDELSRYTKLERLKKQEEFDKLTRRMGGISDMSDLPGAVFVTDLRNDHLAVKEAQRLGIPVVAIADTNNNPEDADYPIPANDDALSSLKYVLAHVLKKLEK